MKAILDESLYTRPFSHRELLTAGSLALTGFVVGEWMDLWMGAAGHLAANALTWFLFLIGIPANHIIYRVLHKRGNNFIGRIFQDLIFISLCLFFQVAYHWIFGSRWLLAYWTVGAAIGAFASLIILLIGLELIIALLKRILKWFGCNVL